MALCHEHGQKHLPQVQHITALILAGETLKANVTGELTPARKTATTQPIESNE